MKGYIVGERMIKEQLTPQVVSRMFELDFAERENGVALSREDRQFLRIVEEGIRHRDDMHYEIPLPFRESNVQLPNNRSQTVQRLYGLKKRFQGGTRYRAEYVSFMSEITGKGYARKVSAKELRPLKKESVVFDCSARYQGESLNDHLLQGPDLSSKLTGVLTRFGKERVALMADVEKMFFQVKVKKEDQNFFSFLWWTNEDSRTSRVLHHGPSLRSWFITRMFQLCPETTYSRRLLLEH